MSGPEFDEMSRGQRQKSDASQTQLSFVKQAFLELFKLLEQYAPVWYTEEHASATRQGSRAISEGRLKGGKRKQRLPRGSAPHRFRQVAS